MVNKFYLIFGGKFTVAYMREKKLDASGSVMVNKLDYQTCKSGFKSHSVPYLFLPCATSKQKAL